MALISIRKITKWFEEGNIIVCGKRGKGKDVLFGNVIARMKRPYISNLDYTNDNNYIPLDFKKLDCGGNGHRNLLTGKINYYEFPYPDKTHVFISDAGLYFPCQYNEELNKEFPEFPVYMALSRHLADAHVHVNSQALNRPWDKIREQAENVYIMCTRCKVLFGKIVFAQFRYYEKYDSAESNVPTFPYKEPIFKKKTDKINIDLEKAKYQIQYGVIKNYTYICWNKSKHNSRYFKDLFASGNVDKKYTKQYFEDNGMFSKPIKKNKKGGKQYEREDDFYF